MAKKKAPKRNRKTSSFKKSVNPMSGLSSKINSDFVITVLSRSTRAEIDSVLRKVVFRDNIRSSGDESGDVDHTIGLDVRAFLNTLQGRQLLDKRRNEEIQREIQNWLDSKQGRAQLQKLKSEQLADEFKRDTDAFNRACQAEVQKQIQRWLRSPAGEEAIEQARFRESQTSSNSNHRADQS